MGTSTGESGPVGEGGAGALCLGLCMLLDRKLGSTAKIGESSCGVCVATAVGMRATQL